MNQARHVFGDITNASEDVLASRRSSKGKDDSYLVPPRSPVYASDFTILQDSPSQAQDATPADFASIEADPSFETPPKLSHPQSPHKAPQHLGQVLGKATATFPSVGKENCKLADDGVPEMVALCAAELHDLWEESVKSGVRRIMCLQQKFGSMGPPRLAQAFFCPPQGTPPPPYIDAWPHRKRFEPANGEDTASSNQALPTIEQALATSELPHDSIERNANGALCGLVSDILRTSHVESEHRLPDARSILTNFSAEERETTMLWLFQVSASVNFTDSVLYMAVHLLDRFCAGLSEPIPLDRLQLITVAVLSISLKMNGAVDENSKPPKLQNLLVHLTQNRFTSQEIFSAEHEVLRFLGFEVSLTTSADFLDSFLVPHGVPKDGELPSPVRCIAQFLLQLSLLDAPLHYRYPSAVMAAGAVYVALWCTQRGPEHVLALLQDVAVCFNTEPQLGSPEVV